MGIAAAFQSFFYNFFIVDSTRSASDESGKRLLRLYCVPNLTLLIESLLFELLFKCMAPPALDKALSYAKLSRLPRLLTFLLLPSAP